MVENETSLLRHQLSLLVIVKRPTAVAVRLDIVIVGLITRKA